MIMTDYIIDMTTEYDTSKDIIANQCLIHEIESNLISASSAINKKKQLANNRNLAVDR